MITIEQFEAVDIQVGTIVTAELFPEGKYSSHILHIDFGGILGVKKSLARLVPHYGTDELVGTQVLAVVNFAPRQIGKHFSEVLTLGLPDQNNNVVLLHPERPVPNGGNIH